MAVFESYTADTGAFTYDMWVNKWYAQGFTPSTAHTITSVKFYLSKQGTPSNGNITVSIKATSGGLPTGADLASGTINSSIVSIAAWHEITFSVSYALVAGTVYAMVARFANGDSANYIAISLNNGDPYTRGVASYSLNGGSSWTEETNYDFHFQDIGSGGFVPKVFII